MTLLCLHKLSSSLCLHNLFVNVFPYIVLFNYALFLLWNVFTHTHTHIHTHIYTHTHVQLAITDIQVIEGTDVVPPGYRVLHHISSDGKYIETQFYFYIC